VVDLEEGFAIVQGLVLPRETVELRDAAAQVFAAGTERSAGVRRLVTRHAAFERLARDARVLGLVEPVLGREAFAVRSILFDKSPSRNWDVVWHQDTTIAVSERRDVPGFGPWSIKDGVVHVQPPAAVLEGMLTVRIHLDDCGPENGALQVVPGSHRSGIITDRCIDPVACEAASVTCAVRAGDAVLMRPLILHASKKAAAPTHRRVVHLEFAATDLPGGLRWARC
jgi:ectoine hydroxylase-related dioxygenase (phytanoyl-CoA dioxygenase family)